MKVNKKVKIVTGQKLLNSGFNNKYLLVNSISAILFTFLALYLTVLHNRIFLLKLQDLSLFLPTKMFFLNNINSPGGFLSYLGLFFTQFFYYPWLGSLIVILFLYAIQFLTLKAFKFQQKHFPLSFIPSLLLLLTLTQLGYIIFTFKSNGYIFSNMFGVMIVLGGFWIYRNIRKNLRLLFSLLFIIIFFPLAGFYSELAVLLFLLFEIMTIKKDNNKYTFIKITILLILILVIPFLYYRFFYLGTSFPRVYIAALPILKIDETLDLWLPFFALFAFFIFAIVGFLPVLKLKIPYWLSFCFPSFMFLMVAIGVYHYSYDDENFRTELAMDQAIFENNWKEVLKLSRELKSEPTRLIVMNTHLALQKLHIAGDKMFYYKNGNKPFNSRRTVFLMDVAGKMFYFQYGKLNYSYRWCMQDMIKYGMKIETLKYFVKSSLLNEEFSLAKKYNDILMKTLFHRSWAIKYQKYIAYPEKISLDPEFKEILPLLLYKNESYKDKRNMLEDFLKDSFVDLSGGSFEILNLSMQFNLKIKDINRFWNYYLFYIQSYSDIPVHYQEAALLYAYFNGEINISKIKIDDDVLNNFKKMTTMLNQYAQYPKDRIKSIFIKDFGNTFWYYFFFNEQIKVNLIAK